MPEDTTADLAVGIPRMRYDITLPIVDGRVTIPGVRLTSSPISSMINRLDSPMASGDFGLADLNLGYLLPALEAGWELIGLPIFTKRKPVYPMIFCRADRGIESPRDLAGKRVGTRQYRTGITIWSRGLLEEHYGVDWSGIEWEVGADEVFPLHRPAPITHAPEGKSAVDRLLDGAVDAIITDISDGDLFRRVESHPDVHRLFPDYRAEDLRLFRETGIYTPVHLLVMSAPLARQHPELPRQIYDAFDRAKAMNYQDQLSDRAGFSVVYLREQVLEQTRIWGDPWEYGITANQTTMETFIRYNVEQGMIARPLTLSQIFAASTLDT